MRPAFQPRLERDVRRAPVFIDVSVAASDYAPHRCQYMFSLASISTLALLPIASSTNRFVASSSQSSAIMLGSPSISLLSVTILFELPATIAD